ncbi:MAG: hypothetical protein KDF60_08645 [Calditrichaeota bacterium]|nr:hypothetical protein [Calditrichota bacterium]
MPWHVKYLDDLQIILVKNSGVLDYNDYKQQTIEARKLVKQHKTHGTLVDDRELINNASEFDLIDMPDLYDELKVNPKSRIAIWVSKEKSSHKQFLFFEEICSKRGWQVKLFEDRSAAISWLKQPE